jgi:hypothetical protein
MKKILLLTGVISLLATTGCVVAEGGRQRHGRFHGRTEVFVPAPVVIVPAARVHVR